MIYFIQSGRSEFVKIGHCAGEPRTRLGQLQVGNPEELRLIAVKEGGQCEEAIVHEQFAHLRVRGEWFQWDADLREFAKPLLEDPDTIREARQEYVRALVAGRTDDANAAYAKMFSARSWSPERRQAQIERLSADAPLPGSGVV